MAAVLRSVLQRVLGRLPGSVGLLAAAALAVVDVHAALADPVVVASASVRTASPVDIEFVLGLSAPAEVEISAFEHPYRVVVELPDATFGAGAQTGPLSGVCVTGARFEAMPGNRGRVVVETAGPVTVTKASIGPPGSSGSGSGVALVIAIKCDRPAAEGPGEAAAALQAPATTGSVKGAVFEDGPAAQAAHGKPIILIDPGHGGIDPGAIGKQHVTEKAVVLGVARELQAALEATGRYDARLTRSDDTYVALTKRVELSRQQKADLFISLHADATDDDDLAKTVHGASIYTLSEKASDEQARLMADKENAADLVAGIDSSTLDRGEDVKGILYDLMSRESAAFSHLLAHSVAEALGKSGSLAKEPERSAAFRVLKQAHAPSVLIELGFLSNPEEEQRLISPAWQKQTAKSLRMAVERYFAARYAAEPLQWTQGQASRLPP